MTTGLEEAVAKVPAAVSTVVAAVNDRAAFEWLAGAAGVVRLEHCPSVDALRTISPTDVDGIVVDCAMLELAGIAAGLRRYHDAAVPILILADRADWTSSLQHLQDANAAAFECLCPEDPPAIVALRLAAATRVVQAERDEAALRAQQLEHERNKVVVQLAGAVAHKLKQPLAVVWGYLELLLDDPNPSLDPTTRHYLSEIREAARTMDDVVNRLQRATVYQTRQYAGALEILNLDDSTEWPHNNP